MCGIYGFNFDDVGLAGKMGRVLEHRGPDGCARTADRGATLGHRRLSIIDLSKKGRQPMPNEEGNVWVTYNGEIYNFIELREALEKRGHRFFSNTDTEVIVHAYEEWGENCVLHFNGMFAFCIYDSAKKKLFLARDPLGIKPLYYHFDGKKFVFASEIKAILEDKSIKRSINKKALNQYISLRYNPEENTIFEGIKKLLPGHTLSFCLKEKALQTKRYWDLSAKTENRSEAYYLKSLERLLLDAVKRQMISDVPLGVFLSGGIDSSLITSYMRKNSGEAKIKSFSVGFEEGEGVDERAYARRASEITGTDHKEYIIPKDILKVLPEIVYSTDEPMADQALLPLHYLSKKASMDVKVVLTGDGGDELFLGYEQYSHLERARKTAIVPGAGFAAKKAVDILPLKFFDRLYKHSSEMDKKALGRIPLVFKSIRHNEAKAYYDLISIFSEKEREEVLKKESYEKIDYRQINKRYFTKKSLLQNLNYFDTKRLLPESFLMKTDRMTMANSIEARVPLLDYRIAELAFRMPISMKTGKAPLKKLLLKDFPKSFVYRKKQTFHVPINRWFAKQKSLVKEYDAAENKHFDKKTVKKIIEKTKKGNLYSTRQFFNLIVFDIWEKRFMG